MSSHLKLVPKITDAVESPRRVLVISDVITATQFISFLQPLQSGAGPAGFALFLENCPNTAAESEALFGAIKPDFVVLSRCTHPGGESVVRLARENGVPYIYHLDDDLLRVPASLGADKFRAYNNPARIHRLVAYINAADLVYVSTAPLKDALIASGIAAEIFAGEIYCAVDSARLPQPMPSGWPVIGYMGTSGHANDLDMVLPAVERLLEEFADLRFEVFGTIQMPERLLRFGNRVMAHTADLNYPGFIAKLHALGWWIGLAPLEDNEFNRCKADTKWVEYTAAGVAAVASDLAVYHRACADGAGLLVADEAGWHGALKALLRDGGGRERMAVRAREKLRAAYSQEALRAQVLGVLDKAKANAAART